MSLLAGKAVVITGSGRGIGAACARGAARQGAALVVNDVDPELAERTVSEIRSEGAQAVACVADVTDWEDSGRLVRSCIEHFGRIDGLVNNAGLAHIAGLDAFDPVAARALIDVNVMGSLHCSAHAVKPMLAQGSGVIVNVISGAHMGLPKLGVYAASKGAAASMIYSWALELEGTGIRVNGLSPIGAGTGMSPDDPSGQPPEANSAILEFLLSDRAAGVNGQMARIDGTEIHLYAHPALLLPPAVNANWTAQTVAEAFERDFAGRLVPCGVMGIEGQPVKIESGYWQGRKQD